MGLDLERELGLYAVIEGSNGGIGVRLDHEQLQLLLGSQWQAITVRNHFRSPSVPGASIEKNNCKFVCELIRDLEPGMKIIRSLILGILMLHSGR